MATVVTVFTRSPWVRTPQQVVESLFRTRRPSTAGSPAPREQAGVGQSAQRHRALELVGLDIAVLNWVLPTQTPLESIFHCSDTAAGAQDRAMLHVV
jgi:hypothetical protein